MKVKKYKLKIENCLIIIFVFVYLITVFSHISPLIGNMLIALVGILSFIYVIIKQGANKWPISHIMLYAIMLSFCMVFSIMYNGNGNLTNILWIWGYAGIALILWIYPISSKFLFGIFYIVAIIFLIYALKRIDPQQVFNSASGNNISAVLMYFMLIAYWKYSKNDKSLPYIPAMFFLIISFWGNGRAGILTSVLFLSLIFIYNFLCIKKGRIQTLVLISFLIMVGIYVINHSFGDAIAQYEYKMQRYKLTSVRTEIWSEYLKGAFTSMGNFIFGVPTKNSIYPKLNYYSGNTHNAFLMLHSKFGIVGFLFFFCKIITASIKTLKKQYYVILIIIISVVFRSFFDWTAFPGFFDVYFWLMVLYAEKNNKI